METKSQSLHGNSDRRNIFSMALGFMLLLLPVTGLAGPVSPLYLTAGQHNLMFVVQGTNVIRGWTVPNNSYAIAVNGTVQITIGASGFLCSEYTLAGTNTGVSSTFPNVPGSSVYDATSDGVYIYAWDANQNRVLRFDSHWSNPVAMFSIGGLGFDFLGITYDSSNNSLWISGWNKSEIRNYSMTGQLLSSFAVSHNAISALALDPATGTLWTANRNVWGLLEEYSKSGVLLTTHFYPDLSGMNMLGGEFNIETPDTTPPQIVSIVATPSVIWPANNRMVPVNLSVHAVDDSDPSPEVKITQLTCNERAGPGTDWEITGPLSVNLRAKRSGKTAARIYTITVECKDAMGNVASAVVQVSVTHNNK